MTKNIKYWIAVLLVVSSGLLGVLVPGGPIETRNFSHIEPITLGVFNTFLTLLSIGSLLLVYFIFRETKWASIISALCGVSYFLVYVLDLGVIFPVSSDPMPMTLWIIEIVGTIVSLPLVFLSVKNILKINQNGQAEMSFTELYSQKFLYIAFLSIFLGFGIITFATISAMGI